MMEYQHIGCIAGHSPKAKYAKHALMRLYPLIDIEHHPDAEIDVLIVLGGDGFMLHTLHKYLHWNIPFYGMNSGTIGFLMNRFAKNGLMERLLQAKSTFIHPLCMETLDRSQETHHALAINEVSLLRETNQAAKIQIHVDHAVRIETLVCDGVLVSTPAGSSAYNLSAGGPIIPIDANLLALTAISPFRPRRWHGALLPHTAEITFHILEPLKRPVSAVADFHEIRDVLKVQVREEREKRICLLFDPDHSLEERMLHEQFHYT